MNSEQLNAIKERAEKATPGPWELDTDDNGIWNEGGRNYLGSVNLSITDAEFIAHAREDIPQLVAEVERLQKRLSECESLLSEAHDVLDDVHCYETEVYVAITKYLYEEESE